MSIGVAPSEFVCLEWQRSGKFYAESVSGIDAIDEMYLHKYLNTWNF